MRIVFLDALTIGAGSFAALEALGEFVGYGDSTPQEGLERVAGCDVLIVNKFKVTPALLDAGPSIRLVCESGTGMNNIDVAACEARGIPLYLTEGANHSLETGDVEADISTLAHTMRDIGLFMEQR